MSIIRVRGDRSDYVIINLDQVAWAEVQTNETGGVTRAELHMSDGKDISIREPEAGWVVEGLRRSREEMPTDPEVLG